MTGTAPRTLIAIPTYDERENIRSAIDAVLTALPDASVLVVDDASPDGTGDIADGLALDDPRIDVLHRREKDGLGGAYLAAFAWARARGFAFVGEFDADGSHPVDSLPLMRAALVEHDDVALVIGSRWIPGGRVVDWPRSRELLSRAGNGYARAALGLAVHDATAGFRLYRVSSLTTLDLDSVVSKGYCFQVDMTVRVVLSGARILEVPIVFRERQLGASKMSSAIVLEAMWMVTVWGLVRRAGPRGRWLASRLGIPAASDGTTVRHG